MWVVLRIERLQFDNYKRLANAIQLYLIIGWYLLRLIYIGKASPDKLASAYFDELDIQSVTRLPEYSHLASEPTLPRRTPPKC
jgi:hypothetical protein